MFFSLKEDKMLLRLIFLVQVVIVCCCILSAQAKSYNTARKVDNLNGQFNQQEGKLGSTLNEDEEKPQLESRARQIFGFVAPSLSSSDHNQAQAFNPMGQIALNFHEQLQHMANGAKSLQKLLSGPTQNKQQQQQQQQEKQQQSEQSQQQQQQEQFQQPDQSQQLQQQQQEQFQQSSEQTPSEEQHQEQKQSQQSSRNMNNDNKQATAAVATAAAVVSTSGNVGGGGGKPCLKGCKGKPVSASPENLKPVENTPWQITDEFLKHGHELAKGIYNKFITEPQENLVKLQKNIVDGVKDIENKVNSEWGVAMPARVIEKGMPVSLLETAIRAFLDNIDARNAKPMGPPGEASPIDVHSPLEEEQEHLLVGSSADRSASPADSIQQKNIKPALKPSEELPPPPKPRKNVYAYLVRLINSLTELTIHSSFSSWADGSLLRLFSNINRLVSNYKKSTGNGNVDLGKFPPRLLPEKVQGARMM